MAEKNNAQPAEQTKPAEDAAVVDAPGGAVEQPVTPVREAPGDAVERLADFLDFARTVIAGVLENAGASVRDGGQDRPVCAEDLLAVSIQGRTVAAVTRDGRKYLVTADANHETE